MRCKYKRIIGAGLILRDIENPNYMMASFESNQTPLVPIGTFQMALFKTNALFGICHLASGIRRLASRIMGSKKIKIR